jgi:hypothetical protein
MSSNANVTPEASSSRPETTPGRIVAWVLFAAAVVGLLLLIYSTPR